MADNDKNEVKGIVDTQILNIGVPQWQNYLAEAVNQTYSYTNSSLFCSVVGGYYRDYAFRFIRPACQWLDGYVPAIHWGGSGIISTRIASSLINGLSRTIVGEKLVYKVKGDKDPQAIETLRFASEWGEANNIKRAIKNAIAFSEGIGTSLLKANIRNTNDEIRKIWWEAVRFDNCFYLADAGLAVKDATFLLRSYTDTRDQSNTVQYFLAEHRFYKYYDGSIARGPDGLWRTAHKKGERVAMVEYKVHRAASTSLNNTMATSQGRSSVKWTEIPKEVRKLIKEDYNTIKIDEAQELGLSDLGVEVLCNDDGDISIPTGTNFGRSLIVPIIDDLLIYEIAESYAIRDMYLGKGTVYIPKNLNLGDYGIPQTIALNQPAQPSDPDAIKFDANNVQPKINLPPLPHVDNALQGVGDKFETVPGVNPEDQQLVVNQFNLRPQEWQLIQENALKRIAVKWGMSPKILSSFLAQGAVQMTATQVDSEDDISIAFINQARAIFKPAIARLLETTLNFYGRTHNVDIDFASPSIINKDRILDRVIKKLQAGLCSLEDAVREINPDLDEESLQAKIQELQQQQMMQMLAAQNEFNAEGGFGNNEEDLGGANLRGSTSPVQ